MIITGSGLHRAKKVWSDPEMLDLLRQENAYTSVMMQHTGELQDRLFNEIAQRLADNKKTVPVKKGNFEYH